MNVKPLSKVGKRDAKWVLSFGAGTQWLAGEDSGFRPNRLAELIAHGVLVATDDPAMLVVGDVKLSTVVGDGND